MSEEGSRGSRKRPKVYYGYKQAKRKKLGGLQELRPGMQGVLITTNDQEKICVSEAYNLLNEYADQLYGPEVTSPDEGVQDEGDIESSLAKEMENLKGSTEKPRRFQACTSGAKHVVFILCQEPVDPYRLVHHMLSDVTESRVQKSRFCQRVIPVTKVCYASLEDIEKQALSVLEPHFHTDDLLRVKFAVNYKCRNNNEVKREDVINLLASMVTRNGDYAHKVDLSNPELTVVVEIVKNLCCLSVVKDFQRLKKYNIHTIMEASSQHPAKPSLKAAPLVTNSQVQDANSQVQDTGSKLQDTDSKVQDANSKVQDADSKVQDTDSKLQDTNSKLQDTDSKLQDTDSKLQDPDSKVQDTDSKVQDTDSKLQDTDLKLQDTDSKGQETV